MPDSKINRQIESEAHEKVDITNVKMISPTFKIKYKFKYFFSSVSCQK